MCLLYNFYSYLNLVLVSGGLEDDAAGIDGLIDKHTGQWGEVVRVLGGEVFACAALAAMTLDFRVTLQVVGKAVCHDGPLLDNIHALGHILVDFVDEQGIVGATQDDGVYFGAIPQ